MSKIVKQLKFLNNNLNGKMVYKPNIFATPEITHSFYQ